MQEQLPRYIAKRGSDAPTGKYDCMEKLRPRSGREAGLGQAR